MLLAYDCEKFIAEALHSVIEQDYDNMEIVVSDDASDDGTYALLQRALEAPVTPRDVKLRRRSVNSGSKSAHLNDVFSYASGDIIVFFDGDDISDSSRVRRVVNAFVTRPDVQAVYSAYSLIDEDGRTLGRCQPPMPPSGLSASAWFARVGAYASGGTLAIRRAIVDSFGALIPTVHEDVTLPFRASLLGDVAYLDEALVDARRHPASLTQNYAAYASLESYRERFNWGIERADDQRDSKLADLRAAEMLMPERVKEFEVLRAIVSASANTAKTSVGLVSTSFWVRIRTALRLRSSEYYVDSFSRDLSLALVPKLYLYYKRHRLGSRRGGVESVSV